MLIVNVHIAVKPEGQWLLASALLGHVVIIL